MMTATPASTHRQPFGPVDALRVLLYSALLVSALVAPGGRYLFVVAGAIAMASIVLTLTRVRRPLSLIVSWELAFLLLVVLEGTARAHSIIADVSGSAYGTASRYLIAANCAVVLGHAIVFRAARFRTEVPWTWRFRSEHTVLFLVLVTLSYYVMTIPWVWSVLRLGRNNGFSFGPGALAPLFEGFSVAAGMALPSMYVYAFTRVLKRPMRGAVLLSLPVLVAHFVVGTRFPLLFAVAGMFITRFGNEPIRLRTWLRGGALALVVIVAMGLMVQFRGQGLGNVDPGEVVARLASEGIDTTQEVVLTEARIVDYYERNPSLSGRSTTSVFVFWVPRALWPGKPTLLEYWFPREYGLRGFGETHSIAAGFPADGYADFGFVGGLVVCLFVGLGLGAVDRGCSRLLVEAGSPYLVLVGPLFGATFFAVRSLNTAVIAATGLVALAWMFSHAVGARRVPVDDEVPAAVAAVPRMFAGAPRS